MKGYVKRDSVPRYRVAGATVCGTITDGSQVQNDVQLPIASMGKEVVDYLHSFPLTEGVEALERNFKFFDGSTTKSIGRPLPVEMCHALSKCYQNENVRVISGRIAVSELEYSKVLSAIRGYLLELIMKIESELINSGGEEASVENRTNQELQNIITNHIQNMSISASGTGNVINTGDANTFTVTNNVRSGDITSLKEALRSCNVSMEDISELEAILTREHHNSTSQLSPATANWVGNMFSKSLTGAWQVASGTAANLLAPMISAYLGMPMLPS